MGNETYPGARRAVRVSAHVGRVCCGQPLWALPSRSRCQFARTSFHAHRPIGAAIGIDRIARKAALTYPWRPEGRFATGLGGAVLASSAYARSANKPAAGRASATHSDSKTGAAAVGDPPRTIA